MSETENQHLNLVVHTGIAPLQLMKVTVLSAPAIFTDMSQVDVALIPSF